MPRIFLLLALLGLARVGAAQQLLGAWYCPERTGLREIAVDQLSAQNQLVTTAFQPLETGVPVFPVVRLQDFGDAEMLLVRPRPESEWVSALVGFEVKPGRHFRWAWNVADTLNPKMLAEMEDYLKTGKQLWGPRCYSARYIDTLRLLRPLESMTREEFGWFFDAYVAKDLLYAPEILRRVFRYPAGAYRFDMLTETLFEGGFNPLQDQTALAELFQKFAPNRKLLQRLRALLDD